MSMNIFRRCGDMSHLTAILILLLQLHRAKNARGISVKTQELRLLVFCSRYLDLFTTFYSMYNSIMKMIYISATAIIIYRIKYSEPIKSVYNHSQDSFPIWKWAVAPCVILATITHLYGSRHTYYNSFSFMEWLWTYSIFQESIAILPQLVVLQKYRLVENLTGKFVFFLGLYRLLYIFNWIYRAHTERNYRHHYVVYVCGFVQTLLYADFFYQYCKALHCCRNKRDEQESQDGIVLVDDGDYEDSTSLLFEMSQQEQNQAGTIRKGRSTMTGGVSNEPLLASMVSEEVINDESLLLEETMEDVKITEEKQKTKQTA